MKTAATKILKKLSQPEKTQFERLVDEALAIHKGIASASNQFGDARDEKMSARGYLAEALKNARTTRAKIEELDALMARVPEDGNQDLFRFLSTATRQASAIRMDQGVNLRPPTSNLHRLVAGDNAAFVGVLVQGGMIGANPLQLIALAALRATRDSPENFGSIDDWAAHHAAMEKNRSRFDELAAQIAKDWRTGEFEVSDPGADGRALITIKVGGAAVPLGDPATLAQRICEALA
jgi:hypothetical protein